MTTSTISPYFNGNITLSGGNLTGKYTGSNSYNNIACTTNCTYGNKWYWEQTITTSGGSEVMVGFQLQDHTPTTFLGADNVSYGWATNGSVYFNNAVTTTIQTFAAGNTVCIALDLVNNAVWFRTGAAGNWNNSGTANPATNTGGLSISSLVANCNLLRPSLCFFYTNDQSTINLGGSAFAGTAPAGFSAPNTWTIPNGLNAEVASHSASFTQYGANRKTTPSSAHQITAQQASRGSTISGAWFGGNHFWSPAAAATHAAGNVKEGTSNVSGREVIVLDNRTKLLLGTALSDGSGNYSIPALGRSLVDVIAYDPTTFEAEIYDRVTPV